MSSVPYYYLVDYEPDPIQALKKLRERVFESGQYEGSDQCYKSLKELMLNLPPSGTRSILDIIQISENPGFSTAACLNEQELQEYFGTANPTVEVAEDIYSYDEFWDDIGRGQARFFVLHSEDGRPNKYIFAGYSYD